MLSAIIKHSMNILCDEWKYRMDGGRRREREWMSESVGERRSIHNKNIYLDIFIE